MRTNIDILISALRILANDIQSEDGIANAAIREAAERLQEERILADRLAELVNKPTSECGWDKFNAISAWREARK